MSSIKKNLKYQTLYQLLNVGFPLITAPFISRVLGAEPLGIMSYTGSVVNYFVLFAMMGLSSYGTRSIAVVKDKKSERDNVFSQIFYMQLITTLLASVVYVGYILLFCEDNVLISWIQGIAILACFFDINWFFFGIEEFRITVIRSTVIRICSVSLMLLLVKNSNDLWIYALLLIGSQFISQIVLWFYAPKFLSFQKPNVQSILSHFKPNFKLFLPLLAMSVYHIMDKTMLGALSTYTQSGYYYNADKVINIPIGLLTGVGTVMLPRMSALAGLNRKEELDFMFNTSIKGIGLISSALCCGIAAVSNEFTPFFFGEGYDDCIILIITLAPVLFIKGLSLISRNLYLIPNNMENKLINSVIAGAVVNLIVNLLLIPFIGAFGAVVGTLAAETISCIWQYVSIRENVNCVKSIVAAFIYFVFGIVMFFCVRLIANCLSFNNIINLIIEIVTGIITYCFLCIVYWIITKNKTAFSLINARLRKP